jgi:hypothetical protein
MADQNSPLNALYQNKNDMTILTYPHDLGSSRKGHFISFNVQQIQKGKYTETKKTSSDFLPTITIPSVAASTFNSVSSVASQAASAASSISGTIGAAADIANQAISTAAGVVGAASSVVGAVSGASSIISGAASSASAATNVIGTVTGVVGGAAAVTSSIGALTSTVGDIPGVSSFLNDPMASVSSTWDSIKNFVSNPSKLFSSGSSSSLKTTALPSSDPIFTPAYSKPIGYINLYMPDTVNADQHASYNDLNMTQALGKFGGAQEGLAESSQYKSLYDQLRAGAGTKEGLGNSIRTLSSQSVPPTALEGIGIGGQMVGAFNNGNAVGAYLLKTAGYAINPQLEVVFSQMDFRKFQFDFTLTPRNKDEAETIRNIIQMFRIHAAPELQSGDPSSPGRYFIAPSVFNIEYWFKEGINTNLHKFMPCVLETIRVDYAPEVGWVTHDDGMPVKTRLTLQFRETEILTQEKIRKGY